MKTVAIIPARGGSKRLKRKNIYPVFGKPMLGWSIEACQRSNLIDEVFISTEDDDIAKIALEHSAQVILRPTNIADDKTPKMEVIRHADQYLKQNNHIEPQIIVSVQANSPELNTKYIDQGIEMLTKNDLYEVISIGNDMIQNAAFRVIKQSCLYNTYLSAHLGAVSNECLDVHTIEDIKAIEEKHQSLEQFLAFITL